MRPESEMKLIQNFRQVCDFLEEHPEVPIPWQWQSENIGLCLYADTREQFLAAHKAIGGRARKDSNNSNGFYTLIHDTFGPIMLRLSIWHGEVCYRVCRTRIVPAKPAASEVPEHEEEYDEWVCPDNMLKICKEEIDRTERKAVGDSG